MKNNTEIFKDKIGFIYTKVPSDIDYEVFKQECQNLFE